VNIHRGCFYINGQKMNEKAIKIDAIEGHLGFDNKVYQGSFISLIDGRSCFFINQLELEDYVYSVLRSESWPGWPLEVNKVFAVASRTYVLAKIVEGGTKKPYHIKNTNIHQTYKGFHESDTLKKAVEQTKGLIVTFNKKPIHAMFDSCCGGIIPADLSSMDFKKAPYLARTVICDFCKPCKIYTWKCEFDCHEFEKLLQEKGFPVSGIKAIQAKHDKAGAVQEVAIHGSQGVITLTGKQAYSLTTKIKSFCYSIQKKLKKIIFEGKGYGHHLGLCQWGVRNMIDQGWGYKDILKYSYPGTTCMKLVLK
jgi:stage II sporulation protein D